MAWNRFPMALSISSYSPSTITAVGSSTADVESARKIDTAPMELVVEHERRGCTQAVADTVDRSDDIVSLVVPDGRPVAQGAAVTAVVDEKCPFLTALRAVSSM